MIELRYNRLTLVYNRFHRWIRYKPIFVRNYLSALFRGKAKHKFLFILCPPYSGSTLLNEILSTSKNVSVNNPFGTREGQRLTEVTNMMMKDMWNPDSNLDWVWIKKQWMKYWNLSLPVLLEKSPPNIVRATAISEVFKPSYFVILVRDPYSLCEGLMRRNKWETKKAAEFVIMLFESNRSNSKTLQNVLLLSYEELTNNPTEAAARLINFIPELGSLDIGKKFQAHNLRGGPLKITNLNQDKINNLSAQLIDDINVIFSKNVELIRYFGYDLMRGQE